MNLEQANHCVQLAQFLENLKDDKWDYIHVRQSEYDIVKETKKQDGFCVKTTCNTTACALGWCPEVFPKNFRAKIDDVSIDDIVNGIVVDVDVQAKVGNSWHTIDNYADKSEPLEKWFGFDSNTVDQVFWGDNSEQFYGCEISCVTNYDVAKKLYKLVREAGYEVV